MAVVLCGVSSAFAASTSSIALSFQTSDPNVQTSALVGLKENSPDNVELATQERADKLVGVISATPLISITDNSKSVQVVTSGVTNALVSDMNGDVKTGDKIAVSAIAGVGMKAKTNSVVVGAAQADLASTKTTTRQITDTDGQSHTVRVGVIPVQVSVMFYASPSDQTSFLPSFLQDFANGLAGKNVSPVRVIISSIILVVSFASIIVLLYASVQSSIISIGRNPLSEGSVRKSLFQIGSIVISVLLLALITIYLILTT